MLTHNLAIFPVAMAVAGFAHELSMAMLLSLRPCLIVAVPFSLPTAVYRLQSIHDPRQVFDDGQGAPFVGDDANDHNLLSRGALL